MQWIKASERKPKSGILLPLKVDGKYYVGYMFDFGENLFSINHEVYPTVHPNNVEWLDEGESQEQVNEDELYESIYMEVVELVEKDNIQCEFYYETAKKLESKYLITHK